MGKQAFLQGSLQTPYADHMTDLLITYRDKEVADKNLKQAIGITCLTGLEFAALAVAAGVEAVVRGLLAIGAFLISLTQDRSKQSLWQQHAHNLNTSAIKAFALGIFNVIFFLGNPFAHHLNQVSKLLHS